MPDEDTTRADVVADERVVGDLSCAHCGYNLRTLLATGRCPECGNGVADSLRMRPTLPPLQQSDGTWLRNVATACMALCASAVLPTLGLMWVRYNQAWLGGYPGRYRHPSTAEILELSLPVCGVVMGFYGVYLLGRAEPARPGVGRHQLLASWLRMSAIVYAAGVCGTSILGCVFASPLLLSGLLTTLLMYIYMYRLLGRCSLGQTLRTEAMFLWSFATVATLAAMISSLGDSWAGWRLFPGFGDPVRCLIPPIDGWLQTLGAGIELWALAFWARCAVLFVRLSRSRPGEWFGVY